jgi:transcription elongation GreA/GreB family factor
MDKRRLLEELAAVLREELAAANRVAKDTAEAANHPEARPENDKDTRKLELSYLAAGQAARAKELETGLALLAQIPFRVFGAEDALTVGAFAELDVEGKTQRVLLSPAGGGLKLAGEEGEINVVTPASPLGRGLLGKCQGDAFELAVGGEKREVTIVAVA